jgi:hypothetical protein
MLQAAEDVPTLVIRPRRTLTVGWPVGFLAVAALAVARRRPV